MVDSNMDGVNKATTSAVLNDNVHEDTAQQADGMEWSEVDNLNIGSSNSGQKCEEENHDRPQASSQARSELHYDQLPKDVHRLVDVINCVIRSHSALNCGETRVLDYLDFDIFNYEEILEEVRSFGAQELIEESMNSLALDTVNDAP